MLAWLGGLDAYEKRCDEVAAEGYRGFALTRRMVAASAKSR
jgi:hypothetical protein